MTPEEVRALSVVVVVVGAVVGVGIGALLVKYVVWPLDNYTHAALTRLRGRIEAAVLARAAQHQEEMNDAE